MIRLYITISPSSGERTRTNKNVKHLDISYIRQYSYTILPFESRNSNSTKCCHVANAAS